MSESESDYEEKVVEVQGGQRVVLRTHRLPAGALYSFDEGETWHLDPIEALRVAKEAGKLVTERSTGSGLEAFVVGLVEELRRLEPGGSLRITHGPAGIVVTREEVVLAVRASDVRESTLRTAVEPEETHADEGRADLQG